MNRRSMLAAAGAVVTTFTAGCSGGVPGIVSPTPSHYISVGNRRETSQEVFVELTLNEIEHEYGPRTVAPETTWDVTRIESRGRLTVRVSVNGELVWDESHEVPTSRDGVSVAELVLEPDDDIYTAVWSED